MSVLRTGDEDMHYSDHSHRWIAPPDVDQDVWDAMVGAHMYEHRVTIVPARAPEPVSCPVPRIPRPRLPIVPERTTKRPAATTRRPVIPVPRPAQPGDVQPAIAEPAPTGERRHLRVA